MDKLARDVVAEKKQDLWYDKVFVKHFVKKVQELDENIGAMIYPDTFLLAFVYNGIIIYKISLNKENVEDISIEKHLRNIRRTLGFIRTGLIPATTINNIKASPKGLKHGKIL